MDTETLKYLEEFRKEVRQELKDANSGINSLTNEMVLVKRDIAEIKANEEKRENRNWDWKKSITIVIVGATFATVLGVSVNSMVTANAENKRMQLELQKKELELKQKELEEKYKTK